MVFGFWAFGFVIASKIFTFVNLIKDQKTKSKDLINRKLFMKICRFGDNRLGLVEGSQVRDVTEVLSILPGYHYPLPKFDPLIQHWEAVTARIAELAAKAPVLSLAELKLLSPVTNPTKIVAAPVNYQKHLNEVKADASVHHGNVAHTITIHSAGLFLKAVSSLCGAGEGIQLRHLDRRNDHEVELVAIIGKQANNVAASEAMPKRVMPRICYCLNTLRRACHLQFFRTPIRAAVKRCISFTKTAHLIQFTASNCNTSIL